MTSFNFYYLLLILPALGAWWAQAKVREAYTRYREQVNSSGVTGLETARVLLEAYGLQQVQVERIEGELTDHYDPRTNVLRLTEDIAKSRSVTAVGIVGHEVGHALQDAEGHRLLRLRGGLAKNLGRAASLSPLVFIGGMMFGNPLLMGLGGLMLAGMTVFALVTLPVERDASKRARAILQANGLAGRADREGVEEVLRAAAVTYLAGLGRRLASFLFFVMVIGAGLGR